MWEYKVSVIVPIYNVEKYLAQCLEQLAAQTLEGIEVLLINDGSPDHSQEIIDRYTQKYPQIFTSYTKKNGGLSDARNFGIERAKGKYIGFVDSDDLIAADMYQKLYEKAESENADVVLCGFYKFSDKEKFRPDVSRMNWRNIKNIRKTYLFGKNVQETPVILRYATSYAWNKLYRRDFFGDFRFPVGRVFEDSARIYSILAAAEKIALVEEPLYYYRVLHNNSITQSINKKVFDVLLSCQDIVSYFKQNDLFEHCHDEIEYLCIMHLFARMKAFRGKRNFPLMFSFVDQAFAFLDKNFPDWRQNPYQTETYIRKKALDVNWVSCHLSETKWLVKLFLIFCFLTAFSDRVKKGLKRRKKKLVKKLKTKTPKTVVKEEIILELEQEPALDEDQDDNESQESPKTDGRMGMDEQDLRDLQMEGLRILKCVDRFCEEKGLTYYLAEGTLLGAVRHQGFIPWDDDVDILMPREDYDRFVQEWGEHSIDQCVLLHQTTYDKYYLPFAKIISRAPTGFRSFQRITPERFHGPSIDVFPLDHGVAFNDPAQLKTCRKLRRVRNILLTKVGYIKNKKKRRKYWLRSKLFSHDYLFRKLYQLSTENSSENSEYLVNFASSYLVDKECFPKEYFGKPVKAPFEDALLSVPQNADKILQRIYGDYMQLPPEHKRVCRHTFYREKH